MKKISSLFFFLSTFITNIKCQSKQIDYGNNPAAGSYYNIRGVNMYCEVYGTGKPLLLIHGNGGSIKSFSKNIAFFSKKYKVIALDSRAQGKSVDHSDSLSFEMMADDEAALLNAMHIDSAYVLGWSDGGINAILLAIRHPEKVIKLASTGANLWADSTAIDPDSWKSDQIKFNSTDPQKFTTAFEKNSWKLFLLDWLQPNISLKDLSGIKCPSFIIGGDHDLIPVQHTALIYENIQHAYLWILPNSGHATLVQYADIFNEKVDEFFSTPFVKW